MSGIGLYALFAIPALNAQKEEEVTQLKGQYLIEANAFQSDIDNLNKKIARLTNERTECERTINELGCEVTSLKQKLANVEPVIETVYIENPEKSDWTVGEILPLPSIPSNVKFCTDYRFYNIPGTPHNRLQQVAWTDELGCRRYNEDYIVGLGSFYSVDIGDRFEVTLDTGKIITIILGDGKADWDTDENNMFTPCYNYDEEYCANILEFIVDTQVMSKECYRYGSLDYHDELKGNVVQMVYLGRDNGGDWTTYA